MRRLGLDVELPGDVAPPARDFADPVCLELGVAFGLLVPLDEPRLRRERLDSVLVALVWGLLATATDPAALLEAPAGAGCSDARAASGSGWLCTSSPDCRRFPTRRRPDESDTGRQGGTDHDEEACRAVVVFPHGGIFSRCG